MALKMIDLSQEIYQGMSVFPMHQKTFIMTNMTHEQNMEDNGSKTLGFPARNLLISEYGDLEDALSRSGQEIRDFSGSGLIFQVIPLF